MNIDHIRGLIREKRLTIRGTAHLLRLSEQGFYNKLNGLSDFTVSEVKRLSEILHVPIDELIQDDNKSKN